MENAGKIRELIQNIAAGKNRTPILFPAKVVSVSKDTCTVDYNGLELTGVRINAITDGNDKKNMAKPKKGSMVLIADLSGGDKRDLAIIRDNEIESIKITNGSQDFITLFGSMLDTLIGAVITTPAGAGSFAPDVIQKLTQTKTEFKKLFYA